MKYGLGLLVILLVALFGILTGLTIKQNNDIEDLQAQIEVIEEQIEHQQDYIKDLEEQIEQQQDYIEEIHKYVNDYTYEDGGRVFVYIDEDGNHYD